MPSFRVSNKIVDSALHSLRNLQRYANEGFALLCFCLTLFSFQEFLWYHLLIEHSHRLSTDTSHMVDRPKALQVLHHPFFWNSAMRLSFLHDTSDRVELEDREANSDILTALESVAPIAVGTKWDEKMDVAFINDIGRYRRYKYDSVRHLLRVMRNKLNHYRELPAEIQVFLCSNPFHFWM